MHEECGAPMVGEAMAEEAEDVPLGTCLNMNSAAKDGVMNARRHLP